MHENVANFEREFALFCGVSHAIGSVNWQVACAATSAKRARANSGVSGEKNDAFCAKHVIFLTKSFL